MREIHNLSQLLDALSRGYTVSGGKVQSPRARAAREPKEVERHFCVAIAGHTIGIDTLYAETYSLCQPYFCDLTPEFCIKVCKQDLAYEREEARNAGAHWNNGYLETLAVYRKISEAMLDYDTFLMHGAVVAVGDNAYMFTAESGTGKTTHIQKWLDNIPEAIVVNGDKPLIRVTDNEAIVCGTPWSGKEKLNTNTMVPLKTITLMERGEDNQIEEISFGEAFAFLLRQTYRPDEPIKMQKTLNLIFRLNGKVRFFRFVFNNMKDDAFSVAYKSLTGGKP